MIQLQKKNHGFIALVSVIIVSLILTVVVFALSFGGFSLRFNILGSEFKEISFFSAKSCRDIAILKLSVNNSYLPRLGGDDIFLSDSKDGLTCKIVSIFLQGGETVVETSAEFEKARTNLRTSTLKINGNYSIVSSYEVINF